MLGTGAITVNGGTLQTLNHHQFGYEPGTYNTLTINDGGTLATGAFDQFVGVLTLNDNASITGSGGYIGLAGGGLTYTGSSAAKQATVAPSISLGSPGVGAAVTFTVNGTNAAGDLVLNNSIWRDGGSLTKAGAGTLVLNGTNTYSGGTTLAAGTLRVGNNTALGTGAVALNGGAISSSSSIARALSNNLTVGGAVILGDAANSGALTLSGTVGLGGATRILTIASTVTLSGIVSNGGLTKAGAGTLTLDAANTYAGATIVSGGTLAIGASGSLGASAAIQVAADATLDVSAKSGFTLGSAQTLSGGGTVSGDIVIAGTHTPGFSPGLQTFEDNLTYGNGSAIVWELAANSTGNRGTAHDAIDVLGDLTLQGTVSLSLLFDSPGSGVDWTNAFWDSEVFGEQGWKILGVTGTINGFANLQVASSTWLDANGVAFATARPLGAFTLRQEGTGVYLNYTPVPEPSTYGLALGALALAASALRRRRKSVPTV
jgi:MYXO-CTERM domain-containing protein